MTLLLLLRGPSGPERGSVNVGDRGRGSAATGDRRLQPLGTSQHGRGSLSPADRGATLSPTDAPAFTLTIGDRL